MTLLNAAHSPRLAPSSFRRSISGFKLCLSIGGVIASMACSDSDKPVDQSFESGGSAHTEGSGGDMNVSASGGSKADPSGGSPGAGNSGDGDGDDTNSGGSDNNASGGAGAGGTNSGGADANPVSWPLINGVQWADTNGNPIQAHGGGMLKVGEDYYWFGENRNPDSTFLAVSAYRSRDLRRWEHVNDVLTMDSDPGLKPANVERPKVVYNAETQKYVMWMHWENGKDYGEARAAVASSDTVAGNYTYHGSFRPLNDSGVVDHGKPGYMSRDCTLFVDDDGKGYFLSAANENYDLHLYLLSADYLTIDRRVALLFEGGHREAPALFKRNGTYFLVTSGSTGWNPNQAQYATSSSIASGWSDMNNVADANTFYSQSTYVQPVSGTNGTEYLYMGDRWAGAYGGRVNDSSYVWQSIAFPSDTSMSMSWANNLTLDTQAGSIQGSVDAFVFMNKKSNLLLSVDGPVQNSASVIVAAEQDTKSQAWRLNYNGSGHFRLSNEAANKVIDVPDESTAAGAVLKLWDDVGGDHQAWTVLDLGGGDYRLRNKKSGLYLGITDGSSGAAVAQQTATSGDEQIWRIAVAPR